MIEEKVSFLSAWEGRILAEMSDITFDHQIGPRTNICTARVSMFA